MLEVELTKRETLWNLSYKYVDGFQEEVERLVEQQVTDDAIRKLGTNHNACTPNLKMTKATCK